MQRIRSMVAALAAMGLLASSMVATPAMAGPAAASQPVCAGLVAYNEQSAGPNSSRLMAVPATGGTPRVLWDRADAVQGELDPAWSPNGRSVAFAGRLTDDSGVLMDNRLYVLRAGAAEPEIVVNQLGQRGGLRFPSWSPDGTRIAYLTGVPPADQPYRGLAWVHIVDLTTGQDRFLTGFPDPLLTPDVAWSPRGDQLLVTALNPINFHWTVYSVRPDPADPRPTVLISDDAGARGSTGFPTFLPGGRAVLVEQDEPDGTASRLYLADPHTEAPAAGKPAAGLGNPAGLRRIPAVRGVPAVQRRPHRDIHQRVDSAHRQDPHRGAAGRRCVRRTARLAARHRMPALAILVLNEQPRSIWTHQERGSLMHQRIPTVRRMILAAATAVLAVGLAVAVTVAASPAASGASTTAPQSPGHSHTEAETDHHGPDVPNGRQMRRRLNPGLVRGAVVLHRLRHRGQEGRLRDRETSGPAQRDRRRTHRHHGHRRGWPVLPTSSHDLRCHHPHRQRVLRRAEHRPRRRRRHRSVRHHGQRQPERHRLHLQIALQPRLRLLTGTGGGRVRHSSARRRPRRPGPPAHRPSGSRRMRG